MKPYPYNAYDPDEDDSEPNDMSEDLPELECEHCGWQGHSSELLASEEWPGEYTCCPDCDESDGIADYED